MVEKGKWRRVKPVTDRFELLSWFIRSHLVLNLWLSPTWNILLAGRFLIVSDEWPASTRIYSFTMFCRRDHFHATCGRVISHWFWTILNGKNWCVIAVGTDVKKPLLGNLCYLQTTLQRFKFPLTKLRFLKEPLDDKEIWYFSLLLYLVLCASEQCGYASYYTGYSDAQVHAEDLLWRRYIILHCLNFFFLLHLRFSRR